MSNFQAADGCNVSDEIATVAADADNHGQFVSGVAQLTNALKQAGWITGTEKGAMPRYAPGAAIP